MLYKKWVIRKYTKSMFERIRCSMITDNTVINEHFANWVYTYMHSSSICKCTSNIKCCVCVCVRTFVVRLQFSICKRTVNTYAQWHSFFRMICFFYCHYNSADVAVHVDVGGCGGCGGALQRRSTSLTQNLCVWWRSCCAPTTDFVFGVRYEAQCKHVFANKFLCQS